MMVFFLKARDKVVVDLRTQMSCSLLYSILIYWSITNASQSNEMHMQASTNN